MMYEKEEKQVGRKLKRLAFTGKLNKSHKLVLFGACENTKIVMRMLLKLGLTIDKIVDNDRKKVGTFCSGVPVEAPEVLRMGGDKNRKILFYTYYEEEITNQLKAYGYRCGRDFFSLIPHRPFQWSYLYQAIRVMRGRVHYNRLKRKYGADCQILVCPYTGIGDVYLIGVMLGQYLAQRGIKNYVLITVSAACRKVAQIFEIPNIEQMKKQEAERLIKAHVFAPRLYDLHVLNDSWASIYLNPTEWLRGYGGLTFTDMFRYVVFETKGELRLTFPDGSRNRGAAEELFQKYGLPVNKTVVLAPYSNTLSELPEALWEEIAARLNRLGYVVCTNSCGAHEPAVRGTEAIFFPLNIAIEIVNLAGGFIGVRSGFCDVVSSSSATKVVIYEQDSFFYQGTTLDYFSLKKMGLCDDAHELLYDRDIHSTAEKITSYFCV